MFTQQICPAEEVLLLGFFRNEIKFVFSHCPSLANTVVFLPFCEKNLESSSSSSFVDRRESRDVAGPSVKLGL
jgi:hypothetical protein